MLKRKFLLILIVFINCNYAVGKNDDFTITKKKIQAQNKMLIDLFINLELTEKNYNLSTLIDYVPKYSKKKISKIEIKSNLGNSNEEILFTYKQQKLSEILYSVDRRDGEGEKRFKYRLEYLNDRITKIYVNGNSKYQLEYNYQGKFSSIAFTHRGVRYIYNVEYSSNTNGAKLRLDVIKNEKVHIGNDSHKKEINWDKNFRLTSFEIYRYSSNNITYNMNGDVSSFEASSSRPKRNKVSWQYIYDKNRNWTKRTYNKTFILRKIYYK